MGRDSPQSFGPRRVVNSLNIKYPPFVNIIHEPWVKLIIPQNHNFEKIKSKVLTLFKKNQQSSCKRKIFAKVLQLLLSLCELSILPKRGHAKLQQQQQQQQQIVKMLKNVG